MKTLKPIVARIPVVSSLAKKAYGVISRRRSQPFRGSSEYWEQRYRSGGTSGDGSYGKLALFKAQIINEFVQEHKIDSVIEFGCGDGNQLHLARYPEYVGLDVSPAAVEMCREKFAQDKTKSFSLMHEWDGKKADLALSLDVIYHLIEDAVFERYMTDLFQSADRYIIIYSSNHDDPDPGVAHVRHRAFSDWVRKHAPQWSLVAHVPNKYNYKSDPQGGSFSDFYIFAKR